MRELGLPRGIIVHGCQRGVQQLIGEEFRQEFGTLVPPQKHRFDNAAQDILEMITEGGGMDKGVACHKYRAEGVHSNGGRVRLLRNEEGEEVGNGHFDGFIGSRVGLFEFSLQDAP